MDPTKLKPRRQPFRVVLLLSVGAILLVYVAVLTNTRLSNRSAAEPLRAKRDQLKSIADELVAAQQQASSDRDLILNVFAQCRSAEDIPDLDSDYIIAARHGSDDLCFFIPEGTHTLEISSWKPRPAQAAATAEPPDAQQQSWSIALAPSAGYWLKIVSGYRGDPLRWELTSNDSGFAARSETLLERFSDSGRGWSGAHKFVFPGQIEQPAIHQLDTAIALQRPMELMDLRLYGKVDDQPVDVTFAVKLHSDAPPCVSASGAQQIIIFGREDVLLPYQGGGKYELKLPPQTDPAPR